MAEELLKLKLAARTAIRRARDLQALESVRIEYLGRERGKVTGVLRALKDLPQEKRKKTGELANAIRREIEALLENKSASVSRSESLARFQRERLDITIPGQKAERGHPHPITKLLNEAEDIFLRMGFTVAEGPEIETEHYNFDALNIQRDHPARDMWDTFWLKEKTPQGERLVLRTHTSPVQIRHMETHQPPIRIISPGITYRYEATDASHDIEFWQIEGLLVDRAVTVGNLKAVIQRFFAELFGSAVKIRLRPSYFPFVEPGFEVDISCLHCGEKGCAICGQSGWLEMLGAGMVHPQVFKNVGYNPQAVTGFAFGMGFDRLVMMKYKIPDIRLMRSGDLRFLNQF